MCNKIPIYRKTNLQSGHMDTTDLNEGGSSWPVDGGKPLFYACSNGVTGSIPVYRGSHMNSKGILLPSMHTSSTKLADVTTGGWKGDFSDKPNFYAFQTPDASMVPIYQVINPTTNDRMTTLDANEGTGSGYTQSSLMMYGYAQ